MVLRALSSADEAVTPASDEHGSPDGLVGARIRELRKAQGRTLQSVASAIGISVSYLSQIERDVSRLPIRILKDIADQLGVHMNWFFAAEPRGPVGERDVVVRKGN